MKVTKKTRKKTRKKSKSKRSKNIVNNDVHLPSNKIVKVKLSEIIKKLYLEKIGTINNMVYRTNQIVTHTFQFLKLYCIDMHNLSKVLPVIDHNLITLIMKTISTSNRQAKSDNRSVSDKNKEIKISLNDFLQKINGSRCQFEV